MKNYWQQVISVFSGTLVAQLIPILSTLLITRIYAPDIFGEFATWMSIITLVSVVLTLRFDMALAIINDGKDRNIIVGYILIISLTMAVLLGILLIISAYTLDLEKYLTTNHFLIALIIPGSFFLSLTQVWQTWASVEGYYKKLIYMRIFQALLTSILQIFTGILSPTTETIAFSFIMSLIFSYIFSSYIMPSIFSQLKMLKINDLLNFMKRYKKFFIYGLPADFINNASNQLPLIIVSLRFGYEISGYLALTTRVLSTPISLLGKAVLDVFKRHAAQNFQNKGNCAKLYRNTFYILAIASIIMCICTILFAESIFSIAFGSVWQTSGIFAIWLLPMFALRFIASPLSYIIYLVEKQDIDLKWQLCLFIMTVFTLYISSSYKISLISYSLGYAALYCIYLLITYQLSLGHHSINIFKR